MLQLPGEARLRRRRRGDLARRGAACTAVVLLHSMQQSSRRRSGISLGFADAGLSIQSLDAGRGRLKPSSTTRHLLLLRACLDAGVLCLPWPAGQWWRRAAGRVCTPAADSGVKARQETQCRLLALLQVSNAMSTQPAVSQVANKVPPGQPLTGALVLRASAAGLLSASWLGCGTLGLRSGSAGLASAAVDTALSVRCGSRLVR